MMVLNAEEQHRRKAMSGRSLETFEELIEESNPWKNPCGECWAGAGEPCFPDCSSFSQFAEVAQQRTSGGGTDDHGERVFCGCVRALPCRDRGMNVFHRLMLARDGNWEITTATPAHVDSLLLEGRLEYAHCVSCEVKVTRCPAFRRFLLAPAWELSSAGRDPLRQVIRRWMRAHGACEHVIAALAYLLVTYGRGHVKVKSTASHDMALTAHFHNLWQEGDIALVDVHYWYRVLNRLLDGSTVDDQRAAEQRS